MMHRKFVKHTSALGIWWVVSNGGRSALVLTTQAVSPIGVAAVIYQDRYAAISLEVGVAVCCVVHQLRCSHAGVSSEECNIL